MQITPSDCDLILDNNGTICDLIQKCDRIRAFVESCFP